MLALSSLWLLPRHHTLNYNVSRKVVKKKKYQINEWRKILSRLKIRTIFFSCRSPPVAPAPIGSGSGRDRERQHVVRKREDWVTLSHYELQTDQMSTWWTWLILINNCSDPICPSRISSYPVPCHSNAKSYFHDFTGIVTWIWYFRNRYYLCPQC